MTVLAMAGVTLLLGLPLGWLLEREVELAGPRNRETIFTTTHPAAVVAGVAATAAGLALVYASYRLRLTAQWWSDALMSVGFTLLLALPLVVLSKLVERRTQRQIDVVRSDVRHEVGGLSAEVHQLRESVQQAEARVRRQLEHADAAATEAYLAITEDCSYSTVRRALESARDQALLSPLGIRGESTRNGYQLRLQLEETSIRVSLDTLYEASICSVDWLEGEDLPMLLTKLAEPMMSTPHWPGISNWSFESSFQDISRCLATAIRRRARGFAMENVVQIVGNQWLLSDWDAQAVEFPYQISYRRLSEQNWYAHLAEKTWTDDDQVAHMLDLAVSIRDLALATRGTDS